jgi:predicted GNAT family acetyltransferase
VAVDPDARRSGLAGALVATVTRRALAAGSPAVTVDLYADNHAARRVYARLGFRTAHEFTSWTVPAACS